MEKNIVQLHKKGKLDDLKAFVKEQTFLDLKTAIDKSLSNKEDPLSLTKAVLQGLDVEDAESLEKLVSIMKYFITMLGKTDLSNRLADDIVWLLLMECNRLTGPSLADLAQLYVDSVKNGKFQGGKAMNIFPKILSVIETKDVIVNGDNSMKGSEFKNHILNTLCSCKWSPQTVIHLAAMFKDMTLTQEELRFVLEKIIRQFDDLDLRDLPSLVYQLLLLSEKGHKRLILEGITSFFNAKDILARSQNNVMDSDDLMADSLDTDLLRQTEGTVILHVSFAVMEQRELGQEFLKYLKAWQYSCASKVLSPFNLALALSIAGMNVLNEQILDFLKSTILRSFKDRKRYEESCWVRENFPEQTDIGALVLETVANCSSSWEHVVQGLVQLGFLLMDSFGPRLVFGRPETVIPGQLTPNQSACQLGSKIILQVFKGHEVVRSDTLGQVFNRIMMETSAPASHYLGLLSEMVVSAPLLLLESVGKVREVFDCLPLLPPDTAKGILVALLPLLKISMSLRDSLILLLRKSIFARQLDERKIGVQGFLAMLKSFKVLGGVPSSQSSQSSQAISSSQVPVDVHNQYNRAGNEALCLEILGVLNRCLSQQADIRMNLYQGLVDVISRNTQLKARIMEMLRKQVLRYYEEQEEVVPPLKLEPCITANDENVFLAEPLAHLLSCIQQCVHRVKQVGAHADDVDDGEDDEEGGPGGGLAALEGILDKLTERMIQADMEDFELDKAADFSTANSVGVRNNIFAILLLGTFEVLIEHNFTAGNFSVKSSEHVVQLFAKYKTLCDILREKSGGGKKGRAASNNAKTPNSLLSLQCVVSMLEAIFSDETPGRRESLEILRSNPDLMAHLVSVATQKLQQVAEKGMCDGANHSQEKLFKYCCTLGRLFFTHYSENQLAEEGRERSRKMVGATLEGLAHVLTIACNKGTEAVKESLAALVNTDEQPDIHGFIKRFQRLVQKVLEAHEDQRNLKDLGSLLSIISQLTTHLKAGGHEYEQVLTWTRKLCTDETIDDVNTSKLLMGCLLKLSTQMKSLPQLMRDVMQDLHSQLGDVDREVEVEDRTHFSLITQRTAAPHVALLVLPFVDRDLEDTDWIVTRMKADTNPVVLSDDSMLGPTQQEGFEKLVCTRMAVLVAGLHELCQSAIPLGPASAAVFKTLTKFFTILQGIVKYNLHLYQSRVGHMSSRFEKLVKLIGTRLTPFVYNFITYAQTIESEQLEEKNEKELKKGGKSQKSQKSQKGKARATTVRGGKQDKLIPDLIRAIEEVERYLVKLSKKAKVNLMENIKTSTSRDFRINMAVVQEYLQVSSDDEEEEEEEEENEEEQTTENMEVDSGEDAEQASDRDSDNENINPDPPAEKVPDKVDEPASKKRKVSKLGRAKNTK